MTGTASPDRSPLPRAGSFRSPQPVDTHGQKVLISHANGFIGSIQPVSGPEMMNASMATGRMPSVFISNPKNERHGIAGANMTQINQQRPAFNAKGVGAKVNLRRTGLIGPNFTLPEGQIAVTGAAK